eukprot:1158092-Pelagomonas_calceolata.AAC.10
MRIESRFRLRTHGLKAESYEWLGGSNVFIVRVLKSKTKYMLSSIAIALRCVTAQKIQGSFH